MYDSTTYIPVINNKNMFDSTTYIPVINNKICDEIITQ